MGHKAITFATTLDSKHIQLLITNIIAYLRPNGNFLDGALVEAVRYVWNDFSHIDRQDWGHNNYCAARKHELKSLEDIPAFNGW